jgi:hypothetical protein
MPQCQARGVDEELERGCSLRPIARVSWSFTALCLNDGPKVLSRVVSVEKRSANIYLRPNRCVIFLSLQNR